MSSTASIPFWPLAKGSVPARLVPIVLDWMTVLVVPTSRRMPHCVLPETRLPLIVVSLTAFKWIPFSVLGIAEVPSELVPIRLSVI